MLHPGCFRCRSTTEVQPVRLALGGRAVRSSDCGSGGSGASAPSVRYGTALVLAFGFCSGSCGGDSPYFVSTDREAEEALEYQPRIGVGVNASETKTFRRCV